MKITTPVDMAPDLFQLGKAINDFEKQFKTKTKGLKYYLLVISGELSKENCKAVEKEYQKVGWIANCRTSSENGERPGLTGLTLELK